MGGWGWVCKDGWVGMGRWGWVGGDRWVGIGGWGPPSCSFCHHSAHFTTLDFKAVLQEYLIIKDL